MITWISVISRDLSPTDNTTGPLTGSLHVNGREQQHHSSVWHTCAYLHIVVCGCCCCCCLFVCLFVLPCALLKFEWFELFYALIFLFIDVQEDSVVLFILYLSFVVLLRFSGLNVNVMSITFASDIYSL